MKENDIWNLYAFSPINHNCQHFCAKAIRILGAEYNDKNKNEDIISLGTL